VRRAGAVPGGGGGGGGGSSLTPALQVNSSLSALAFHAPLGKAGKGSSADNRARKGLKPKLVSLVVIGRGI